MVPLNALVLVLAATMLSTIFVSLIESELHYQAKINQNQSTLLVSLVFCLRSCVS